MSKLRPECGTTTKPAIGYRTALTRIYWAVKSRRSLIHGKLHDDNGRHCAIGAFWTDNSDVLPGGLVDEVAAVNDSIPPTALPSERRRHVLKWLEWKLGL